VVQRQTADRQALLLYAYTFGAVTCIGRQTCISTFEQWSSLVARNLLEHRPASELKTVSNTATRYNEPAPVAYYTCARKILIAPGQKRFAFLSPLILSTASDTVVAARHRRADIRTGKLRQIIDLVAVTFPQVCLDVACVVRNIAIGMALPHSCYCKTSTSISSLCLKLCCRIRRSVPVEEELHTLLCLCSLDSAIKTGTLRLDLSGGLIMSNYHDVEPNSSSKEAAPRSVSQSSHVVSWSALWCLPSSAGSW